MIGRIAQSFIDQLLDRVDIVEVVDRRVKLKKTGKNYSARCPFHDEKTPSFSVNPDKQFYYCFGCGAGGNAISFVMDYDHVDFPQAVESLASHSGMEVQREAARPGAAPPAPRKDNPLYALLDQVAQFYQQALRHHEQRDRAVAYLKGRGLSGIVAKQFDVGFAPPGWDNLMSALAKDDQQRELLLNAGMLVENDSGRRYDRFRDRIVFPIRDQRGRIIAFGGRVLGDDKPKYLNSPETDVFHKGRELYGLYQARQANRRLDRILVVEGYMDVIALAQHGITNAVATLGTATSRQHLEKIFRLAPEVVFCFDGDEAGRKAASRAMETALPTLQDGRQARFLFLPEGEDPDTAVRDKGPEHLQGLIEHATPLDRFLFDSLAQGLDCESLDGRARLSQLALPLLRQLPEGVYRQLMFKALAQRTGLSVEELLQLEPDPRGGEDGPPPGQFADQGSYSGQPTQARDYSDSAAARPTADNRSRQPRTLPRGTANLAQSALALLLHQPDMAAQPEAELPSGLEGDDIELLQQVLALLRERPGATTATLLGHWHGTPQGELLGHLASQERLIPKAGIEEQFLDTLKLLSRQPQLSSLDAQIDKLRHSNYADLSELEKLQLKELLQLKHQLDSERSRRKQ